MPATSEPIMKGRVAQGSAMRGLDCMSVSMGFMATAPFLIRIVLGGSVVG